MRSYDLKPLQTHGRYVETWVPPVERFVRYERSDERWARPLGIGTVERRLEDLYDVRDESFNLVGYTTYNPMQLQLHRPFMSVYYLQPEPMQYGRHEVPPQTTPDREIIIRAAEHTIGDTCFRSWRIDLKDAFALIDCRWICVLGIDNRRDWEYELRKRLHDRDRVSLRGM